MRAARRTAATVGLLLGVGACGVSQGGATSVTVVAASSLTGAFGEIAVAFEAGQPDVDVVLTFDGSATLATALIEGAPADLFASADPANLARVAAEDRTAGDPVVFATSVLQIVVPEGNPLGIDALDDLADPEVTLSLCGAEVPCGAYAAQAFAAAGLEVPAAGDQENVKGVLTQVQLGEADAGIVYRTDVLAADGVHGVDLAPDEQVDATYPASVLADASNPEAAAAFLAFLTGDEAQAILRDHGFGPP